MRVIDKDRLRLARKRKGITQGDLARSARCSQATISKLEMGQLDSISDNLGAIIAMWLDRDVEELFVRETLTPDPNVTTGPIPASRKRGMRSRTRGNTTKRRAPVAKPKEAA